MRRWFNFENITFMQFSLRISWSNAQAPVPPLRKNRLSGPHEELIMINGACVRRTQYTLDKQLLGSAFISPLHSNVDKGKSSADWGPEPSRTTYSANRYLIIIKRFLRGLFWSCETNKRSSSRQPCLRSLFVLGREF